MGRLFEWTMLGAGVAIVGSIAVLTLLVTGLIVLYTFGVIR